MVDAMDEDKELDELFDFDLVPRAKKRRTTGSEEKAGKDEVGARGTSSRTSFSFPPSHLDPPKSKTDLSRTRHRLADDRPLRTPPARSFAEETVPSFASRSKAESGKDGEMAQGQVQELEAEEEKEGDEEEDDAFAFLSQFVVDG